MTSIAQIRANQRNAKQSTGPKSSMGKAKSSKNAMTHGIFAAIPLLPGEDDERYSTLADEITAALGPTDAIELGFVERIIIGSIRQIRLREAEAAKLRMTMSDEIVAQRIDELLNSQYIQITAKDISDQSERDYKFFKTVNQEFESFIDQYDQLTLLDIQNNTPNIYALLQKKAEEYYMDLQTLAKDVGSFERVLKEIRVEANKYLEQKAYYHRAYQLKNDMKIASRIPHGEDLALFSKYQIQLDTDIYRAMEALRKYRDDKAKIIEGELV